MSAEINSLVWNQANFVQVADSELIHVLLLKVAVRAEFVGQKNRIISWEILKRNRKIEKLSTRAIVLNECVSLQVTPLTQHIWYICT